MKILEMFGEPVSHGGQESFVFNVLQHMDLEDLQIDVLTPYYCDNEHYRGIIENRGGKLVELGLPFEPGKSRKDICEPIKSYLKKTSYDIAHIHSGSITALAYCAREASKAGIKKVIVHSHSSGVNDNWKHTLIKAYAAPLFKKYATDYCACSVEAAAWKFPSGVMSKVKILNNGVDAEFFSYDPRTGKELRDKYGINEKTLVLGHVGRFTYEKNQAFLLDVLKAYQEDHPQSELMLVLIGEGPDKPGVEEKANNLGLKQSVLFPAEYDKVRDYMQMFDVFLFPSLFEGLGIVGIEAQAAGLPVVASTGVPKAMQLAENVKFVSLEDIGAWCKAIDSFREIERQDQREQIRDRGFDIRDTAKEVRGLYWA